MLASGADCRGVVAIMKTMNTCIGYSRKFFGGLSLR